MESRDQLDKYVNMGNCLCEQVEYISNNIREEIKRGNENTQLETSSNNPRIFYFVEASSGVGKSQLAASLSLPVVYIPLATTQLIYGCFNVVCNAVNQALSDDLVEHLGLIIEVLHSAHALRSINTKFKTVGLLVSLFKEVYGRTNEESLKLLSGYNGARKIKYRPMSISNAWRVLNRWVSSKNDSECMTPIFFIDEVPACTSKNDPVYRQCVFLRNIIRNLNCICVLSGTEAALMNAFDDIREGSRREGVDVEYMRLILKLPKTNMSALRRDSKYASLLSSLSPDVYNSLSSTRPLFAQYIMDAMLREQVISSDSRQLTAAVLSEVKKHIVQNKLNFTTTDGLFGQMAILHSEFMKATVDDPLKHNSNPDIEQFLEAQKLSCIRHHFGKMSIENSNEAIVSLYLASDHTYTKKVDGEFVERTPFKPIIDFESPSNDPFLYLICFRDGLYWTNKYQSKYRISSTFALALLSEHRVGAKFPLFANPNQKSCTGRFLEMESLSAAIISSHLYPNSLSGCPFNLFLQSFIAELNPSIDYVSFSEINNIPSVYKRVKVALLSPANRNWAGNSDLVALQHDSIVLGASKWSSNSDKNDGTMAVFMNLGEPLIVALETKCYKDNVPTPQLAKTIKNSSLNENLITILTVTKFGAIRSDNEKFNAASENVIVAAVEGNASADRPVATNLYWKRLDIGKVKQTATLKRTVIMIDLESIYFDRYALMASCYQKV